MLVAILGEGIPQPLEITPREVYKPPRPAPVKHEFIEQDAGQVRLAGTGHAVQEKPLAGLLFALDQADERAPELVGPDDRGAVRSLGEEVRTEFPAIFLGNFGRFEAFLGDAQPLARTTARAGEAVTRLVPIEESAATTPACYAIWTEFEVAVAAGEDLGIISGLPHLGRWDRRPLFKRVLLRRQPLVTPLQEFGTVSGSVDRGRENCRTRRPIDRLT